MAEERAELNRLEVLQALKTSNAEAVMATVHATLTGGAFQTGFALWLGANDFWLGVIAAIPTFAGLVQIVSSYFVERRGERKRFTAFFSGLSRFLWLPILLIPVFLPAAARFLAFIGLLLLSSVLIQMSVPAFTSWISDLVPPDHRGRYFGRRNMLAGVTTMVVSLPAAWFLDLAVKQHRFPEWLGFGILFGVATLTGGVSFWLLLRQAEPPMHRQPDTDTTGLAQIWAFYRAPFADRNFRRLLTFGTLFAFAQFFAGPFYIAYALQVLKLDYVWLQIFATLTGLASLLFLPLWGYLSDKFGNKPLLAIGVFGVALLPLGWVFTSTEHKTYTLVVLCIQNFCGGLFWSGVNLTQFNLLIGTTPTERKSVYVSAMAAMAGIAGGTAPIVGGILLTALAHTTIAPLGWLMGNYQIIFLLNAGMRFLTLIFLRPVHDSGAVATRAVLNQLTASRFGAWRQIRRMHRARSEETRREAAHSLRGTRTALAVEELISALDDPSLHVREEAAVALGEIGDARAVPALVAHLDDPASGLVDEAADALGRIGNEEAVPPLAHLLQTGAKRERVAAARALGRIGDPAGVPALLAALEEPETDMETREACVFALGSIGDPNAVPALLRCLQEPRMADRSLHLAVVRTLGDLGDARATPAVLETLADAEDPALLSHAAVALGMIGAQEAVRPLLDALEKAETPIARKQILNAVGALLTENAEETDNESQRQVDRSAYATFYPLLAIEPYARDEVVARLLNELARRERTGRRLPFLGGETEPAAQRFGHQRRARQFEKALEQYMAGAFGEAALLLARLVSPPDETIDSSPLHEVLRWAMQTAQRRPLEPEEFLLTLFAARLTLNG